jgi:hypothetical protein
MGSQQISYNALAAGIIAAAVIRARAGRISVNVGSIVSRSIEVVCTLTMYREKKITQLINKLSIEKA